MTRDDIRYHMRPIGNKAVALGIALYDLIEDMETYYTMQPEGWQISPKGLAFKKNIDRLEEWHEFACEVEVEGLELED